MFVECPADAHLFYSLSMCYKTVETSLALATIDTACKTALGPGSGIIGINTTSSYDDRVELIYHLDALLTAS